MATRPKGRLLLSSALVLLCVLHGIGLWARFLAPAPLRKKDLGIKLLSDTGYVLRYLLGQTGRLIVVGTSLPDGRLKLFRRMESVVFNDIGRKYVREELVPRITKLREALASNGIETVLVTIPSKMAIERELLRSEQLREGMVGIDPTELKMIDPYLMYRDIIDSAPGYFVDLFEPYRKAFLDTPENYTFVPWGHHWSSYGIAIAAREVLLNLKSRGWPIHKVEMERFAASSEFVSDSILETLLLPQFFLKRRKEFQWKEPLYRLRVEKGEVPKRRVVVMSDSNGLRLRKERLGFAGLLGTALGCEVLDFSFTGTQGLRTLTKVSQEGFAFERGDLLVLQLQDIAKFSEKDLANTVIRTKPEGELRSLSNVAPDSPRQLHSE